MRLRAAAVLLAAIGIAPAPEPASEVRIGVFTLFKPTELIARAIGGAMTVRTDRDTCTLRGREEATLHEAGGVVEVACGGRRLSSRVVYVADLSGSATDVELRIPGRITRRFHGRIDVTAEASGLVPVVTVDLETAVASVVAAEQTADTPLEALKAQAVAARSYFAAGRHRHRGFDFCDTTHCQFLREPPRPDQRPARATSATAGLVLTFRARPFLALYSATCGGRTRTLAEAGLDGADGYPYFSVACLSCALGGPVDSRSVGHGLGLCQAGARAQAEAGMTFREILSHYYPGTEVVSLR